MLCGHRLLIQDICLLSSFHSYFVLDASTCVQQVVAKCYSVYECTAIVRSCPLLYYTQDITLTQTGMYIIRPKHPEPRIPIYTQTHIQYTQLQQSYQQIDLRQVHGRFQVQLDVFLRLFLTADDNCRGYCHHDLV